MKSLKSRDDTEFYIGIIIFQFIAVGIFYLPLLLEGIDYKWSNSSFTLQTGASVSLALANG